MAVLVIVVPSAGVLCVVYLLGRKAYRKYKVRLAKCHYTKPSEAPAPIPSLLTPPPSYSHPSQIRSIRVVDNTLDLIVAVRN